jgi:DNA modification methylase
MGNDMTVPYYQDENVTIFHGDCREIPEWLSCDVMVTDPPYGRNWKQGDTTTALGGRSNKHAGILHDKDTTARDDALAMWTKDRPAIVFGDLMLAPPAATKLTAIYHKDDNVSGFSGAIGGVRRDCESIYFVGKWPSGLGGRSSVFPTSQMIAGANGLSAKSGGHPHAKPGDVLAALIELCPPGSIADPFLGSGSTLRAAKNAGRHAIGVELDEQYCEIAARRMGQLSMFEAGFAG